MQIVRNLLFILTLNYMITLFNALKNYTEQRKLWSQCGQRWSQTFIKDCSHFKYVNKMRVVFIKAIIIGDISEWKLWRKVFSSSRLTCFMTTRVLENIIIKCALLILNYVMTYFYGVVLLNCTVKRLYTQCWRFLEDLYIQLA